MAASSRIRIFISSPGDVQEERNRARQVVEKLRARYLGQLTLESVLWEELPLQANMSFQQGIDLVLSGNKGVDIAVFILWARLGSRLGPAIRRPDGGEYRSGTEREFDLMLSAHEQSGGKCPGILVYVREDDSAFRQRLAEEPGDRLEELIAQRKLAESFIREHFHDPKTGTNLRAYHTFTQPPNFADRLRAHLIELLDRLAAVGEAAVIWDVMEKGPPFRGLEAFDRADSPVFFGRENEISTLQSALRDAARRACGFLLLLGPSGSGKSSLVRAGLLPAIAEFEFEAAVTRWLQAVLVPGEQGGDLIGGLMRALSAEGTFPALRAGGVALQQLADAFRRDPDLAFQLALKPLLGSGGESAAGLVLLVDQMEELFTDARIEPVERASFLRVLDLLARSGSVWVVATLRNDFYGAFANEPLLLRLRQDGATADLLPPTPAALRRIITGPARAAGLRLETTAAESLEERLLNDATRQPEALPLLGYVLRELYEGQAVVGGEAGLLRLVDYDRLGGLDGAVARRAGEVFAGLNAEAQAAFDSVFSGLVTVGLDEAAEPVRQRVPMPAICRSAAQRRLVDGFIAARLLTASREPRTGEAVVSVAHEAVLRRWPKLVDWIQENRELLRSRVRLNFALQAWSEQIDGRHDELLLAAGKPLADAEDLLARRPAWLLEKELRFIEASRSRARAAEVRRLRRLRLVAAVLSLLTVAACVASFFAYQAQRRATAERVRATTESVRATAERDRALRAEEDVRSQVKEASVADYAAALEHFAKDEWRKGIACLGRSLHFDPNNKAAAFAMWQQIVYGRGDRTQLPIRVFKEAGRVQAAEFSSNEAFVLTGRWGDISQRWNPHTGINANPKILEGRIRSALYSKDGARVLIEREDETVQLWEADAGTPLGPVIKPTGYLVDLSPEGARFVVHHKFDYGVERQEQLWDALTGKLVTELINEGGIGPLAFKPDGSVVAVGYSGGMLGPAHVDLVDARSGKEICSLKGHTDTIEGAVFSPDGQRIVTASEDQTARIWNSRTGKPIGEAFKHPAAVAEVAFSPDGTRIATASRDDSARVWEARTGQPVGEPMKHASYLGSVAFSQDGLRVVTSSNDFTTRVWNVRTGAALSWTARHQAGVNTAVFARDGAKVLTASDDKTAVLWSHAVGQPSGRLFATPGKLLKRVFTPNGALILTQTEKTGILLESRTGELVATIQEGAGSRYTDFSPDDSCILTVSNGNTLRLWDARSGRSTCRFVAGGNIDTIAVNPNMTAIAAVSSDHSETVRIWKIPSGTLQTEALQHPFKVRRLIFAPDGASLTVKLENETFYLWDFSSGEQIGAPFPASRWDDTFRYSPDGSRILTQFSEQWQLWDSRTGKPVGPPRPHEPASWSGQGFDASFSPDGSRLLTSGKTRKVELWNVATGDPVGKPLQDTGSGVFSPDGLCLVTSGEDRKARLWDARTGVLIEKSIDSDGAVSFSPDGSRCFIANGSVAYLFDTKTGQPISGPLKHDDRVEAAEFTADGSRILSQSEKFAYFWDAPTGSQLGQSIPGVSNFSKPILSPDGRLLLFNENYHVQLWDAQSGIALGPPFGDGCRSASFHPDCSLLLLDFDSYYGSDEDATIGGVFPIVQPEPPDPEEIGKIAGILSGLSFSKRGSLEELSNQERLELAERLREEAAGSGPWRVLFEWAVSAEPSRPIMPNLPVATRTVVERLIAAGTPSALDAALELDPGHPLIPLAAAGLPENGERAEFLRKYSAERVAGDARLEKLAAQMLAKQVRIERSEAKPKAPRR